MKKIQINQKNADPIVLTDDDNTELKTYSKELSKVMELAKICILETTSGTIILKPSEISSIFIKEIEEDSQKPTSEKRIFNKTDVIKDC